MLINLINDLLDLAKNENGTFQLHKEKFNMIDSILNTFKTLQYMSQQKNIDMQLNAS